MFGRWWSLPGPYRFLDSIEEDLRAGVSVLLQLPVTAPQSIDSPLGSRIRSNDLWRWQRIDASDDLMPIEVLGRGLIRTPAGSADAATLVMAPEASGVVFWVDGLTRQTWPVWSSFLLDFDHAVRSAPAEHPLVCIPLHGQLAATRPGPFAAIRTHSWERVLGRHDVSFLVWERMRDKPVNPLHRELLAAVSVELAGTDSELAETLTSLSLDVLLSPERPLAELAQQRGWLASRCGTPWACGRHEWWDGRERRNSCLAAACGDRTEIRRRIWRAEVAVLFPFIEEVRAQLLAELQQFWRVPFQTAFGIITDSADLEVGHMKVLARENGAPTQAVRLLDCLARMRHALAHLEPVPPALLSDPDLLTAVSRQ